MSNKLIVAILLDESGSMSPNKQAALAGVNEYINTVKEDYKNNPELGEVYLTLVTFSSSYTKNEKNFVRFKYNLRHISEVEEIPSTEYIPHGGTPLLQAIGKTIESLDEMDSKNNAKNPLLDFVEKKEVEEAKIVVVIQTDGEETAWNPEYSKDKVAKLIQDREAKGNWTFVFLGAGIDAISEGLKMGLSTNASINMNSKVSPEVSYLSTYRAVSSTTSNLRRSASMGITQASDSITKEIKKEEEKLLKTK